MSAFVAGAIAAAASPTTPKTTSSPDKTTTISRTQSASAGTVGRRIIHMMCPEASGVHSSGGTVI